MSTRPFSGTSNTLTGTTTVRDNNQNERLSISNPIPNILNRIFDGQGIPAQVLEEVVDIDQQFEAYQNNRLQILRPQLLYRTGPLNLRTQLLRITREEHLSVTTEPRNLKIISRDSLNKLRLSGKTLAHIGMIVVSVKGLARKKLGTKVLIAILDKRWKSDARKALIACMEVDMTENKGIFYCAPDFLISIKDLGELEIGIQTRGYEDFSGDSNLLIGLGFLGKLTNNSNTGYKLYISSVIDALASKGIKMIKPMTISPDDLGGLDWNISKNLEHEQMLIPEDSIMFKNSDDTYNLRFSSYKKKQAKNDDEASTSGIEKFLEQ